MASSTIKCPGHVWGCTLIFIIVFPPVLNLFCHYIPTPCVTYVFIPLDSFVCVLSVSEVVILFIYLWNCCVLSYEFHAVINELIPKYYYTDSLCLEAIGFLFSDRWIKIELNEFVVQNCRLTHGNVIPLKNRLVKPTLCGTLYPLYFLIFKHIWGPPCLHLCLCWYDTINTYAIQVWA